MVLNGETSEDDTADRRISIPKKELFAAFLEKKYGDKRLGEAFIAHTKSITCIVDNQNKQGHNLCLLLREDDTLGEEKDDKEEKRLETPNHALIGLHHLHLDDEMQLIGFRGFDFSSPVKLSASGLSVSPVGLRGIDENELGTGRVPREEDLHLRTWISIDQFLEENSACNLSRTELQRAQHHIKKGVLVDPCLYGRLLEGIGSDPNLIDSKRLLHFLLTDQPSPKRLDHLVSFLWISAKGYNSDTTKIETGESSRTIDDLVTKFETWACLYSPEEENKKTKKKRKKDSNAAALVLARKLVRNSLELPPRPSVENQVPRQRHDKRERTATDDDKREEIRPRQLQPEDPSQENRVTQESGGGTGEDEDSDGELKQGFWPGGDESPSDTGEDSGAQEEKEKQSGDKKRKKDDNPPSSGSSSSEDSSDSESSDDDDDDDGTISSPSSSSSSSEGSSSSSDSSEAETAADRSSRKRRKKRRRKDKKDKRTRKKQKQQKKRREMRRRRAEKRKERERKTRAREKRVKEKEKKRRSKEKQREKRDRAQEKRHNRDRANDLQALLQAQLVGQTGIQVITKNLVETNMKAAEYKAREKAATKAMSEDQIMLIRLCLAPVSSLSAHPPINSASLTLSTVFKELTLKVSTERMQNQLNIITEGWECSIDLGSVGHFLTMDGFIPPSKESFGGFSVFMFNPSGTPPSAEEMEFRLGALLEDDKVTTAAWGKQLKKFKYSFPTTVDELNYMLEAAADFLDKLSGITTSIAATGYREALTIVKGLRQEFKKEQLEKPAFLTTVLFLIETEQQKIYTSLQRAYLVQREYPFSSLQHLITQRATRLSHTLPSMTDIFLVQIRLPLVLSSRFRARALGINPEKQPKNPKTPKDKDRGEKAWWSVKPEGDSPDWCLPAGKTFTDYFGPTDFGRNNLAKFDAITVPHHQFPSKNRQVCPKYLAAKKCTKNCQASHLPLVKLQAWAPSAIPTIAAAFKSSYQ